MVHTQSVPDSVYRGNQNKLKEHYKTRRKEWCLCHKLKFYDNFFVVSHMIQERLKDSKNKKNLHGNNIIFWNGNQSLLTLAPQKPHIQ